MTILYVLALAVLVPSGFAFDVQVTEVQQTESVSSSGSYPASVQTNCGRDKNCIEDAQEFRKLCVRFNGVADGGRCFFRSGGKVDWTEAWKTCANQGASLAQIHTSSEFLAVTDIIKGLQTGAITEAELFTWISLRKNMEFGASVWTGPRATWYDNATYFNSELMAEKTYFRRYMSMIQRGNTYHCLILYAVNGLLEHPCEYKEVPLCMLTNRAQTFNLIENLCIAENAIAMRYDISVQECANECSKYKWCRSFNHYDDNACSLFTWSWKDLEQNYIIQGLKSCRHYTYKY